MFKYVGDISVISHYIINEFLENKNIAIDATLGNGYDTDFLCENFQKVYAFEIQKCACEEYAKRKLYNVNLINDSHHLFRKYVDGFVDCIMYNLGFLPGGDKEITTKHETSLQSIKEDLEILNSGEIMTICLYRGHDEGRKEENIILPYLESLPKAKSGVMYHGFLNRNKESPILIVVEKNNNVVDDEAKY